ncbi:hypothetical protein [Comamonas testosteroni]|uniref:hypothetical protein n=1 Tax=Comamonas testosteroni TaxID=285 RepID=UPI0005B3D9F3|nr:hypothetical protein [Comamonas testosteroni]
MSTDISTSLLALPGITKIDSEHAKQSMKLELPNGLIITIKRSPLAKFRNGDSFDVWFPAKRPGMAAEVALSKTAGEVLELVRRYAATSLPI